MAKVVAAAYQCLRHHTGQNDCDDDESAHPGADAAGHFLDGEHDAGEGGIERGCDACSPARDNEVLAADVQ